MGSLYQPGRLFFATETGTIINPSNLRNRSFKPLLKRTRLPPCRFHDLRHTRATILLGRDVNAKVVSEMLGHSSISITLDIYSHLLPDMQEKPSKRLSSSVLASRCCTVYAQRPWILSRAFVHPLCSTCKSEVFIEWAIVDSNH